MNFAKTITNVPAYLQELPQRFFRFMRVFFRRFNEEGLFQQAAALTYHTLFSLLPTIVLALLVLSMISGTRTTPGSKTLAEQFQGWMVEQFALDKIRMTGSNGEVTNLTEQLPQMIDRVRGAVQSPATGVVAFGTLLWCAVSLMRVTERAFNHVYHAPRTRTWTRRLMLYWCVLTLGPLGVAGSLWLTQSLSSSAEQAVSPSLLALYKMAVGTGRIFAGVFASWILMFVMYKLVPQTTVKWKSAALGALVGAILWEIGKNLFGSYVRHFTGYGKWYGNLGLIPLFMFWIYYTWNFVLFGLLLSYVHQNYKDLARLQAFRDTKEAGLTDIRWVLPLAVLLYQRFKKGELLGIIEASDLLNFSASTGEGLFKSLKQAGIVHRVDTSESPDGYTLARPPESVTVKELLTAAKTLCETPDTGSDHRNNQYIKPVIEQFEHAIEDWSNKTTIPVLAGESEIKIKN